MCVVCISLCVCLVCVYGSGGQRWLSDPAGSVTTVICGLGDMATRNQPQVFCKNTKHWNYLFETHLISLALKRASMNLTDVLKIKDYLFVCSFFESCLHFRIDFPKLKHIILVLLCEVYVYVHVACVEAEGSLQVPFSAEPPIFWDRASHWTRSLPLWLDWLMSWDPGVYLFLPVG